MRKTTYYHTNHNSGMVSNSSTTATVKTFTFLLVSVLHSCLFYQAHASSKLSLYSSKDSTIISSVSFLWPLTPSRQRQSTAQVQSYRKFYDYSWSKLIQNGASEFVDAMPEEVQFNSSPLKKGPPGANVVAQIRSISQFPSHENTSDLSRPKALRLMRSAFIETQIARNQALITPMTIHVLNLVLFPKVNIHEVSRGDALTNDGVVGLPIFGADLVSLPGNRHLIAVDFQPVLPVMGNGTRLLPNRYSYIESKLKSIPEKYQKSIGESNPLLPWGGDIPPKAQRFFSPYALWTRLNDDHAIETVNTVVWEAFQEYLDAYLELLDHVQKDMGSGLLITTPDDNMHGIHENGLVKEGQKDYLNYRRKNDPARPMLQQLYGEQWTEAIISQLLFPDLI